MTTHPRLGASLLLLGLACGPQVDPEAPAAESSTSVAPASTSGEDQGSRGDGTGSTGVSTLDTSGGGSMGSTTAESGSTGEPVDWVREVPGTWDCEGYEDPIIVQIDGYQAEPPAITGRGCGVTADPRVPPLEGDNCDALEVNPGLPPLQFQFDLPYPDFPGFGPLMVEFIGGYDPNRDELVGVLWTSAVGEPVRSRCQRASPQ